LVRNRVGKSLFSHIGEGSARGRKKPETEAAGEDRQEAASAGTKSRGDCRRIRAGGHGRSVEGV